MDFSSYLDIGVTRTPKCRLLGLVFAIVMIYEYSHVIEIGKFVDIINNDIDKSEWCMDIYRKQSLRLGCIESVSAVRGRVILFHVQTRRGAALCYAVARTGPREIMYRKFKMHQPPPPPSSK